MSTTTCADSYVGGITRTGARRRSGNSLAGQLNAEWSALHDDPATNAVVATWARRDQALREFASLDDVERAVAQDPPARVDAILLALLNLAQAGDGLAGRTVLQLMLGKAIRIAISHTGRDTKENLEHAAVTALWMTIATYPTTRRPTKIAANIAMDTLHAVCGELAHHRSETPTEPAVLASSLVDRWAADCDSAPADLELLELLAWAVDHHTITAADAVLILDIYLPMPGQAGGQAAAARHNLTWPAARQRASRAVRKITQSVCDDRLAAA